VSKLGGVVAGLNLEFRQRIRRGLSDEAGSVVEVHHVGIVVHAVENEVILLGALAVGVEIAFALATRALRRDRACCELRYKYPVAAAERDADP
jgi:hypothetical protein